MTDHFYYFRFDTDKDNFFKQSDRILLVNYILQDTFDSCKDANNRSNSEKKADMINDESDYKKTTGMNESSNGEKNSDMNLFSYLNFSNCMCLKKPDINNDESGNQKTSDEMSLKDQTNTNGSLNEEKNGDKNSMCLKKLIVDHVYEAAYPVHDEGIKKNLLKEWADNRRFKNQPMDAIKDYFGIKIALYFVWLGFYTNMLIFVAIVGVICVIIGWSTLSQDTLSQDMCNGNLNITMCPKCDQQCDYWKTTDYCLYSKLTHIIDNYASILFTIVMALWSEMYVSYWRRIHFVLMHRWGLSELQPADHCPRPEYLTKLKHIEEKKSIKLRRKTNVIMNKVESRMPWKYKYPIRILSTTSVVFGVNMLTKFNN